MKYFLASLSICFLPLLAQAHQPVLVAPESADDHISITQPDISRAFYGELNNYPHTYKIESLEPFSLFVQVLEPDIASAQQNHSGLIVKTIDRGVEEVARLAHSQADWESYYEPFGGDRYLNGPEFAAEVESDTYLVEVSNPGNTGKYVLVVGQQEDFSDTSIWETMSVIYQVKRWYGKPAIAVFQSPFYYVPGVLLLLIGAAVWYWRRRTTR